MSIIIIIYNKIYIGQYKNKNELVFIKSSFEFSSNAISLEKQGL